MDRNLFKIKPIELEEQVDLDMRTRPIPFIEQ